jgi:hypothetical protein
VYTRFADRPLRLTAPDDDHHAENETDQQELHVPKPTIRRSSAGFQLPSRGREEHRGPRHSIDVSVRHAVKSPKKDRHTLKERASLIEHLQKKTNSSECL